MNTTLNLQIDHTMWATVAGSLRNSELGRLFQALAARMGGHDVPPGLLNTSGLRLAFAQLSAPIDESLERLATNRANGARGGRPRKRAEPAETSARPESGGFQSVQDKKTKKEDLSPTPPIRMRAREETTGDSPRARPAAGADAAGTALAGPAVHVTAHRQGGHDDLYHGLHRLPQGSGRPRDPAPCQGPLREPVTIYSQNP